MHDKSVSRTCLAMNRGFTNRINSVFLRRKHQYISMLTALFTPLEFVRAMLLSCVCNPPLFDEPSSYQILNVRHTTDLERS